MKCPMKFNNPCADVDDKCEGFKCMWYVRIEDSEGCAVAFNTISLNVNAGNISLRIPKAEVRA